MANSYYPDLECTTFPDAVDSWERFCDPTISSQIAINSYYDCINRGDFEGAAKIIEQNPRLKQMIINADRMNQLRDAVISLERFFNTTVYDYITGLTEDKGAWCENTEYKKYNVVNDVVDGTILYFIAIKNVPENTPTTDSTYWKPITLKGSKGDKGDAGMGVIPKGMWSSEIEYDEYSLVSHKNVLWYALESNVNEEPSPQSSCWSLLMDLGDVYGEDITITLEKDNWTELNGAYINTVQVDNSTSLMCPIYGLSPIGETKTSEEDDAYDNIYKLVCNDGSVDVYSYEAPNVTINLVLKNCISSDKGNVSGNGVIVFESEQEYNAAKSNGEIDDGAIVAYPSSGETYNGVYSSEVVSVKDFGAVGDGVSDDTDALIEASKCNKPVFFPEGTYVLSRQITQTNNINWYGNGANTIIKLLPLDKSAPEEYEGKTVYNCYMISQGRTDNGYDLHLKDMVLDANKQSFVDNEYDNGASKSDHTVCIDLYMPNDVTLDNIVIKNALIEGCYIYNPSGNCVISNCKFIDNGFNGEDASGLHIEGTHNNTVVSNSIFNNNGFYGILLGATVGATVNNVSCDGNGHGGVCLWGGANNNVISNIRCINSVAGLLFKSGYSSYIIDSEVEPPASFNSINGLNTKDNTYGIVYGISENNLITNFISNDDYAIAFSVRDYEGYITSKIVNAAINSKVSEKTNIGSITDSRFKIKIDKIISITTADIIADLVDDAALMNQLLNNEDMMTKIYESSDSIALFNQDLYSYNNVNLDVNRHSNGYFELIKNSYNSHGKNVLYNVFENNVKSLFVILTETADGSGSSYATSNYHKPLMLGNVNTFTPTNYNQWTLNSGFTISSQSESGAHNITSLRYINTNTTSENAVLVDNEFTTGNTILAYSNGELAIYSGENGYNKFTVPDISDMKSIAFGLASYNCIHLTIKSLWVTF